MISKNRYANAVAVVCIVLCISIYKVYIWNPSVRSSEASTEVSVVTVLPGGSVELYGAQWRMRTLDVPSAKSAETARTPINGRMVAFLFDRQGKIVNADGKQRSKCSASVFDDRGREWSRQDLEFPREVSDWLDSNRYSENCSGKLAAQDFVFIAVVPEGTHLECVDVSFRGSGALQSIARFMLN